MRMLPVPNVSLEPGNLKMIRNSQNEGVPPPQLVPVRGRLCQFVGSLPPSSGDISKAILKKLSVQGNSFSVFPAIFQTTF